MEKAKQVALIIVMLAWLAICVWTSILVPLALSKYINS